MGKNGIPFGDPTSVNDFLKIRPEVPEGYEESGSRLWRLVKDICGTSERFFKNCFVQNACPILFTNDDKHVDPFKLGVDEIEDLCVQAFADILQLLRPANIVAMGKNAERVALKAKLICIERQLELDQIHITKITHPSPKNGKYEEWKTAVLDEMSESHIVEKMQCSLNKT